MAYQPLKIFEDLIEKGLSPEKALLEAKLDALNHSHIEIKNDITEIKKSINDTNLKLNKIFNHHTHMNYWFIIILISSSFPIGKDIFGILIKLFVK